MNLDAFTQAYIQTALWSSYDESTPSGGDPLDANYSVEDISADTLARIISDCEQFQTANASLITDDNLIHRSQYNVTERAGHDFWLTRNGHGAGFWDGDWEESAGEQLTKASKAFGECDLYVGDDGKLYI